MTIKKFIGILLIIMGGLGSIGFGFTVPAFHQKFQTERQLLVESENESILALVTYGVPIGLSLIGIIVAIVGIKLFISKKE